MIRSCPGQPGPDDSSNLERIGSNPISYLMYQPLRDHHQVFGGIMCRRPVPFTATALGESDALLSRYFRELFPCRLDCGPQWRKSHLASAKRG